VLHRKYHIEEIAQRTERTREDVERELASTKAKLYAARLKRPTPFVDKTIYTGWNALAISAYLEAARVLEREAARAFALKTLDRILSEGWDSQTGLAHVIAYSDSVSVTKRIPGVLDDYAFLIHACVDAWQSTGDIHYYQHAMQIAEAMIARFYDATGGGFFDTEDNGSKIGALAARRKPLQDAPTPAANPSAAAALLRLEALNGRQDFREKAEDTLENFAGIVEHFGLHAGTYGLALQLLLLPPVQVAIVSPLVGTSEARRLSAMATARYAVNKTVIQFSPEKITASALPPALAETLPHLPQLKESAGKSFAVVCKGNICLPPTSDGEQLLEQVNGSL